MTLWRLRRRWKSERQAAPGFGAASGQKRTHAPRSRGNLQTRTIVPSLHTWSCQQDWRINAIRETDRQNNRGWPTESTMRKDLEIRAETLVLRYGWPERSTWFNVRLRDM